MHVTSPTPTPCLASQVPHGAQVRAGRSYRDTGFSSTQGNTSRGGPSPSPLERHSGSRWTGRGCLTGTGSSVPGSFQSEKRTRIKPTLFKEADDLQRPFYLSHGLGVTWTEVKDSAVCFTDKGRQVDKQDCKSKLPPLQEIKLWALFSYTLSAMGLRAARAPPPCASGKTEAPSGEGCSPDGTPGAGSPPHRLPFPAPHCRAARRCLLFHSPEQVLYGNKLLCL